MQRLRSLKPHLYSPLDREPRVRKILESIDSPSIMDSHASSSSHGFEPQNPDMTMAHFGQMLEIMLQNQRNQQETIDKIFVQLERQRGNFVER